MTRRNFAVTASALLAGAMLTVVTRTVRAAPTMALTGTLLMQEYGKLNVIALITDQGRKNITTTSTTTAVERAPARLSDVTLGTWISVDATKGANGTLTALSIAIFPAGWKDPARVDQVVTSNDHTMTNGQVSAENLSLGVGGTVTVRYLGGVATIAVPRSATIHRLAVVSVGALKTGTRATVWVRVPANPDGTLTATSIIVDE